MAYNYKNDMINSIKDNIEFIVNELNMIREELASVYDADKMDQDAYDSIDNSIINLIGDLT